MSRGNRPRPTHERSTEERERDREERERRRAARAGATEPVSSPDDAPAHVEQPPASASPTGDAPADVEQSPASASPPEQSPTPIPPIADPPEPEPERPPIPVEPALVEPAAAVGSTPAIQPTSAAESGSTVESPTAAPIAPSPDDPRARTSLRRATGRGAGGTSNHRPRRMTRARGGALLALVVAIVLVWFLFSLFQPFAGSGSGRVIVSIPKGASSSKIGSILDSDGVVSSGFFFNLRALLEGKRSSLHSGRFVLAHDMSYSAAIDALSKPPPKAIAVKVVVPEGYTRRQIADLVSEDALSGSYLAASEHSRLLNPRRYGAPAHTPNLEGFLFPATYELTAGAPVARLVDEQLLAFRRRFSSALVHRAHELGVTPYELLTVASMIEREAQIEHDRPRIAAVIYNRLKEGIPLGIDATIYYAVALQKGIATYTQELTQSQLKIDSPYNTRTHKGLPPTPISNPGMASIEAAAHPAHVPYLYYVAGADGCGEQKFSSTYAKFEKDAAAYQAAVNKNGGHPPVCKKRGK